MVAAPGSAPAPAPVSAPASEPASDALSRRLWTEDLPREHGFEPLAIEGALPAELRGTLYRNGPGQFGQRGRRYTHPFEGDGAVTAARLEGGRALGASRITPTAGLQEERAAGKILYGLAAPWPRRLANMVRGRQGINTAIIPYGQGIGFSIPINTAKPLIPQLVAKGEVTRGYLGVNIQPLTPDLAKSLKLEETRGALVSDVTPGSPAAKAGILPGDVIVSFDKKTVEDARALSALVAEAPVGHEAAVTVFRNAQKEVLPVVVGKFPSEKSEEEPSAKPAQGRWGLQLQDLTPQMAGRLGIQAGQGVMVAGIQKGSPAERAGIQRGDVILEMNRRRESTVPS